jgi:hypothetical protein
MFQNNMSPLSLSVLDYIPIFSLLMCSNKEYEGKEKSKMLDLLKLQE